MRQIVDDEHITLATESAAAGTTGTGRTGGTGGVPDVGGSVAEAPEVGLPAAVEAELAEAAEAGLAEAVEAGLAEAVEAGLAEAVEAGLAEAVEAELAEAAEVERAEAAEAMAAEPADAGLADSDDAEDEKGLIATYRARRIHPKRLRSPLRRLIWLAVVQIVIVGLLMAVQKLNQPLVDSDVPGAAGGTFAVPLAMFIVMVFSVAAGYWFGLAGALRVRTSVGISIAALATWTLADSPISYLRAGATGIGKRSDAGLLWAQLGVLAVFWIWLGCVAVARRQARRHKQARLHKAVSAPDLDGQPWHSRTFLGVMACVLAYYALELGIWLLYAQTGQAATGTGFLLHDLGVQAILLPIFLVLLLFVGSTDLLEWGEIAVGFVVVRAKRTRPPWLLMILTPLVAVGMIANVVRVDGVNVLHELAVVGIPAVLIFLLVRRGGYGGWSADTRSRAVMTGAIVLFGYGIVLRSITSAVRDLIGWPAQFDASFYALVSMPLALAALTGLLVLLADRRTGQPDQRGRGLLLVIIGVLIIILSLPVFLAAAGLPAVLPRHQFSLLRGMQLVASLATIGWLISLAMRRQPPAARQLANVLKLLAGLLIVSWIIGLWNGMARLGADSDYLLAGLFFLTVFWGFVTSGDDLTGTEANTTAYPRDGRILLAVSYGLVANATLLYLGALRAPRPGIALPSSAINDFFTPVGLVVLGSALVIMRFVARATRAPGDGDGDGRAGLVTQHPREPRVPVHSYGAVQVGVAGAGLIATVAALVIAGRMLPPSARVIAAMLNSPYTATVPGPGCDAGGAAWPVTAGEPITTHCGAAGLRVEAGPHGDGAVEFLPPNGFATQNYRVSVTIALGSGFVGCAGIFTRGGPAGRYFTSICGDNSVGIDQMSTRRSSQIFLRFTGPAQSHRITAVAQGFDQSIYVDGTRIGTIANGAFPATEYVGLGIINLSTRPGSVVFSTFTYTPLPPVR
jgi:hypothetical protein